MWPTTTPEPWFLLFGSIVLPGNLFFLSVDPVVTCSCSFACAGVGLAIFVFVAQGKANKGQITIGDAINLAILEEMLRDPMTTIHAEDLQV